MKQPPALWALAMGAFAIGMTEFVAIGLLNQVSTTFGTSASMTGWIVTAYALGVMLGSPVLTWLGLRIPRKTMLFLLMVLFAVGNAVTAMAPFFAVMIVGRVLTSFAHGVFFGLGSVVGAEIAGPGRRAAAVAFMFSGLTLANLAGVPLGAWVGEVLGWRITYGAVALIGAVVASAIWFLVPELPAPKTTDLKSELHALARPTILVALMMTLLGFGGVFAAITYLAPMLTQVTGVSNSTISWFMVILGLGMMVGNHFGGKLADKNLFLALAGSLALLSLALLAFGFAMKSAVLSGILLFFIGAIGFATVPPLQTVTMDEAKTAPTLASVMNIGAFNLGNALAAWLGGIAIDSSWGFAGAPWVGAAMSAVALLLTFGLLPGRRRQAQREAGEPLIDTSACALSGTD